jgi:hypothetical protein
VRLPGCRAEEGRDEGDDRIAAAVDLDVSGLAEDDGDADLLVGIPEGGVGVGVEREAPEHLPVAREVVREHGQAERGGVEAVGGGSSGSAGVAVGVVGGRVFGVARGFGVPAAVVGVGLAAAAEAVEAAVDARGLLEAARLQEALLLGPRDGGQAVLGHVGGAGQRGEERQLGGVLEG